MICKKIPHELETGFRYVNELLGNNEISVSFQKADRLTVEVQADTVVIGYSAPAEALRGMTMAKRVWETGIPVREQAKFDTLTLMVDCSRNAVLKTQTVKELMVTLAMLGFNGLMLYTEDTYEIPGQPYFGHMRGRYSVKELKELDAFGKSVGIQLIPCIQTLAHLNAIFNWSAYGAVHDIDDILLAESQKTYDLIEQMLKTCRECFSSNVINIGMDEAHHLGRGAYTDKNGYSPKPEIMLRHLEKVVELCEKYGFHPVMWSDMFFRMQFGGKYNVNTGELSQEVLDKIPQQTAMCYWNYYTPPAKVQTLEHMFRQHSRMNRELWFAGGSWSWSGPSPKNYFSNQVTPIQLGYAKDYGVKNVIATIWGDDGGECAVWDMLASLVQYGELRYGEGEELTLDARSMDCFGVPYSTLLLLDRVALPEEIDPSWERPPCLEKMALYNDVLLGVLDADINGRGLGEKYARDVQALSGVQFPQFGYLYETQLALAKLLAVKSELPAKIKAAYRAGDKDALRALANSLPQVAQLAEDYQNAYRVQWHRVNKPFGMEIQDIRLGGIRARLESARIRLEDYLNGRVDALEELEQEDLPFLHTGPSQCVNNWRKASSACVMGW